MSIRPEEVQHVARLAALDVPGAELGALARELGAIVEYVGQLADLDVTPRDVPLVGPETTALRPDRVRAAQMAHPPSALSPDFQGGFFTVPRLEAMEDE